MPKWLKRIKKEEEPTYCGFILMQSEWYKEQVEEGLIDHTDCLVLVFQEEKVAELEAQGYKHVAYLPRDSRRIARRISIYVRGWFCRNLRG